MALDESAQSELVVALGTRGGGVDLVRELTQWLAQELIEAEATEVIGAGPYERSEGRVTERNGHRSLVLTTKAGDLELAIPKLRKSSFFKSILEPRRRIDQALYTVVMEAYLSGVSTRSVDALVQSMGASAGVSKSEVSRICAGLEERVAALRNRTLGHTEFPYVYLDAIYVHVRDDALGQVVSPAVVVATGVTAQGGREVLGVHVGDSDAETLWTAFLRSLKQRGLAGVRLVISDAHEGLRAAIR
jgi:putative transposase